MYFIYRNISLKFQFFFQGDGSLAPYIDSGDRENICNQLNDLENWLYEEGEDCDKDIYKTKLSGLHAQTDPIKQRCHEYEHQPNAYDEIGHAIQMTRKAIDEYRSGSQRYDHLTETEIINITEAADKAQKWLDESRNKFQRSLRTNDPPIKLTDIRHEHQTLTTCVNSVLSRPKPKPPTPPATNQNQKQQNANDQQQQGGSTDGNTTNGQNGDVNSNSPTGGKSQHHGRNEKTSNHYGGEDSAMDVE